MKYRPVFQKCVSHDWDHQYYLAPDSEILQVVGTSWIRDDGGVVGNSHSSENVMIRVGKWLGQQGGERGHTEKTQ